MRFEVYFDTHFIGFGIAWGEWDDTYNENFISLDLPFISFRWIF